MKRLILSVILTTMLFSCKDDTQEKIKEATKAVSADLKQTADSVKVKAKKVLDSSKVKEKAKVIIAKGAEKIENGARKIKESSQK